MQDRDISPTDQEKITSTLAAYPEVLLDTLLVTDEGLVPDTKSPFAVGLATYISFILIGLIPLAVYVWDYAYGFPGDAFFWASTLTGVGFFTIGYLKSYVTESSALTGIVETLILGLIAAAVAYFVGDVLEQIVLG